MINSYVKCVLTLYLMTGFNTTSLEQRVEAICKITEELMPVGINGEYTPLVLDCSEELGWLETVNPVEVYMTFKERGECEF